MWLGLQNNKAASEDVKIAQMSASSAKKWYITSSVAPEPKNVVTPLSKM